MNVDISSSFIPSDVGLPIGLLVSPVVLKSVDYVVWRNRRKGQILCIPVVTGRTVNAGGGHQWVGDQGGQICLTHALQLYWPIRDKCSDHVISLDQSQTRQSIFRLCLSNEVWAWERYERVLRTLLEDLSPKDEEWVLRQLMTATPWAPDGAKKYYHVIAVAAVAGARGLESPLRHKERPRVFLILVTSNLKLWVVSSDVQLI